VRVVDAAGDVAVSVGRDGRAQPAGESRHADP
jgi:hypothetical protein